MPKPKSRRKKSTELFPRTFGVSRAGSRHSAAGTGYVRATDPGPVDHGEIARFLSVSDGVDSHAPRSGDASTDSGSNRGGLNCNRASPGIEAYGSRRQGRTRPRA